MHLRMILSGVVLLGLSSGAWSADSQRRSNKKLLCFGWGARDTMYVRDHWEEMEQMPFDGALIAVPIDRNAWKEGRRDTGNKLAYHLFGLRKYELKDFLPAIADLQVPKWKRFTDNFLDAGFCSSGEDHGFDWFDDARWRVIVHNWTVLAEIARQGGCKGIVFDPEHYGGATGAYLFHYPSMRSRVDKSFAEYAVQVRKRGRELMAASRAVYPDMTIMIYWAHSWQALHPVERSRPPETSSYRLVAFFVDGMLEAAAPGAKIFDICEFSYGYRTREQFLAAYHAIVNEGAAFSATPDLYRSRIRAGFGLWLDNENERSADRWSEKDFSRNYFSPEEFGRVLKMALETSDEYVWIYSHAPVFFPPFRLPDAYLKEIERAVSAAPAQ